MPKFTPNARNPLPLCVQEYLTQSHEEGTRNPMLHFAAQQCFWAKIPIADISGQLLARAMQDGLSEEEAKSTIESAYKSSDRPRASRPGSSFNSRTTQFSRSFSSPPAPTAPSGPSNSLPKTTVPSPIQDGFRIFLNTCFLPGEGIGLSGAKLADKGRSVPSSGEVLPYERWLERISKKPINDIYSTAPGCFIRINPFKLQSKSDSDADVTSMRHVLIDFDPKETDPACLEVQYHAVINCPFSIATVSFTGNRGLQIVIRIDAGTDRKLYNQRVKIVFDYFKQYTFLDEGTTNPSRYGRCPEINRALYDKGGTKIGDSRQELLAINLGPANWDEYEKPVLIEFLRPSEFKKLVTPPGTILVGNKHITRGNLFVVGGAPGIGKSRCGLALCESGACGYDWLGLPVHCRFHTLVIQNENDDDRVKEDVSKLDTDILDKYVFISRIPPCGLCFDDQVFRDQITAHLDNYGMPGVVLVDPWNAVSKRDDQEAYLAAIESIRSLFPRDHSGPAIGIFPHTRKPSAAERNSPSGRALLNTLSGSLVLGSLPRAVWVMQSANNRTDCTEVISTCCKNSNGELGPRTVFNTANGDWDPVVGFDWAAWESQKSSSSSPSTPKECKVRIEIMNLVFEGGKRALTATEAKDILKTYGVARSTAFEALRLDGKFAGHLFLSGKKLMWKP